MNPNHLCPPYFVVAGQATRECDYYEHKPGHTFANVCSTCKECLRCVQARRCRICDQNRDTCGEKIRQGQPTGEFEYFCSRHTVFVDYVKQAFGPPLTTNLVRFGPSGVKELLAINP